MIFVITLWIIGKRTEERYYWIWRRISIEMEGLWRYPRRSTSDWILHPKTKKNLPLIQRFEITEMDIIPSVSIPKPISFLFLNSLGRHRSNRIGDLAEMIAGDATKRPNYSTIRPPFTHFARLLRFSTRTRSMPCKIASMAKINRLRRLQQTFVDCIHLIRSADKQVRWAGFGKQANTLFLDLDSVAWFWTATHLSKSDRRFNGLLIYFLSFFLFIWM